MFLWIAIVIHFKTYQHLLRIFDTLFSESVVSGADVFCISLMYFASIRISFKMWNKTEAKFIVTVRSNFVAEFRELVDGLKAAVKSKE